MAKITQYGPRWGIFLSEEEESECQARAQKWLEYKDNEANLFEGELKYKLAGLRGEKAVRLLLEHLKIAFEYGGVDGQADCWDFKISDKVYSLKTQRFSFIPSPRDTIKLNTKQAEHKADYYVFAVNLKDSPEVIVLGQIRKKDFMSRAKAMKAGEHVQNFAGTGTEFVCRADMYYCTIRSLKPIEVWVKGEHWR